MSSEKKELKCVFCDTKKTDKLLLFSEETMSKCKKILRLRKFHKLKYNDTILPDELYDSAYHSCCYKTFTALKRKFLSTDIEKKVPSQPSAIPSATEQPSSSTDGSVIEDLIDHGSLVKDVNLPQTKVIDAEAEQPLEEEPSEVSAQSSTVQTSDTTASANLNLCFFCNKKKTTSLKN